MNLVLLLYKEDFVQLVLTQNSFLFFSVATMLTFLCSVAFSIIFQKAKLLTNLKKKKVFLDLYSFLCVILSTLFD